MQIYLAPMEGVVDAAIRHLLTQIGGYDRCVTEFIRVIDRRLPKHVFYRSCPELHHAGRTAAGTPVYLQLLGQHPQFMAENAQRAADCGALGIDLNFGCPAKAVNKSRGGAILLDEPELLYAVCHSVRQALPASVHLTAKVRLGVNDKSLAFETMRALAEGGAEQLIVHARTKAEGYQPPAHWHWVDKIRYRSPIPVVVNGDINSVDEALRARQVSGCDDLMIGRGALRQPALARMIKQQGAALSWLEIIQLLLGYSLWPQPQDKHGRYFSNRSKQWLTTLSQDYPEARKLLNEIKALHNKDAVVDILKHQLERAAG